MSTPSPAPPVLLPVGPRPLLRGRIHAAAAAGALALTLLLAVRSWADPPRLVALLIFGLSMVELYTVSAIYHIGRWRPPVHRVLRSVDHANIFVLIAGTYTPLGAIVLAGWGRPALLGTVWLLALAGIILSVFTMRVPRWVGTGLYLGMGWISLLALPAFAQALPLPAIGLLGLGGALYTLGAIVYGRKRPNPFPRVLGFHEVFHLFTVAAGAVFAAVIWIWVVPFA